MEKVELIVEVNVAKLTGCHMLHGDLGIGRHAVSGSAGDNIPTSVTSSDSTYTTRNSSHIAHDDYAIHTIPQCPSTIHLISSVRSLVVRPSNHLTDYVLAQPTTWRRQDDPQYADDPEFQQYTTELSDKLFSLTSNIGRLASQIALLGTRRETDRVRERVQDLLSETGDGFKDVGEGLKKVQAWHDLGVRS